MTERPDYQYDVFISYSPADRQWVDEWLSPHLQQVGLRVAVDYQDFIVGMPRIENIERAVLNSRRTIVVLSPNWVHSEWNAFEALLLRTLDPAARKRMLLPALLEPCELPDMLAALERVDFTAQGHWEKQLKRLTRDIQDVIPVRPPWRERDALLDPAHWKRWLRRYRRALGYGAVVILALWLVGSMSLQQRPFHPRQVWVSLGIQASQATQLARAGDVLLIGGNNVEYGCDRTERGLWRSPDGGEHWDAIYAPLDFQDPDQGCMLADVRGFAVSSGPLERVYAATSDAGLLQSDDAGQTWSPSGHTGLPSMRLVAVAVDPANADRVFVALQGGGLYRSDDRGGNWQRLDRQGAAIVCAQGQPLSGTLTVGALLATPGHLVVGTGDPNHLTDIHVASGLYTSTDGGRCWRQVDDGRGCDEYRALAFVPTPTMDTVLIVVRSWRKEPAERPVGVWSLALTLPAAKRQLLWAQQTAIGSLAVQDGSWYIATPLGGMRQGTLDVPARTRELPNLTRCSVLVCDVALAPDDQGEAPLLLAGGRVFRLQQGPWWRGVWP